MRKGGKECFAILGDNRYHSIFGGVKVGPTPCTQECPGGDRYPGAISPGCARATGTRPHGSS